MSALDGGRLGIAACAVGLVQALWTWRSAMPPSVGSSAG